jgi:anti-sigma factor RsiW
MMDCGQVQPKIADYSVGLLRARETEQVEGHLSTCTACARQWRELQAVLGMVERFGSREPPPHLWNGVYNRITAPEAARTVPGLWERLWGVPGRLIAGTVTGFAAAALVAGLLLPSPTPVPNRGDPAGRPMPTAQSATAVQQHAMLAGFEPLADEVGLEAYARLVNNPDVNTHVTH